MLGADQVREVLSGHSSEGALVADSGDPFAKLLTGWGINGGWPEKLGRLVEEHALRTLYEPSAPALPSGFRGAVGRALGVS